MGRLLDQLRISGDYRRLLERALAKRSLLAQMGLDDPTPQDAGLDRSALLEWYFKERLGGSMPPDLDGYIRVLGFESRDALERSLLREYCFLMRGQLTASNGS
jgi:hypothetical protein